MSVKCRNSNKYYPLLMSKFIEDNTESKQNFIDFVNNFFLDADEVLGEFLGGEDVTPPITPKFKITQVDGRTNKEVIDNQTAREYYVRNRDYKQMLSTFKKRILKLSVFDSKDINTIVGDYTLLNKRIFDYKKELLNNIAKYINEVVDPNIDKLLDKDIEATFNDIISKFENVINNYDQNNQKFKNVYNSYVILKTFDDLINSSIQFIQIDPKYIDSSVYSRNRYIYIGPKMRFYTGFSSDEFADIEDSVSKVTELILNNSSKVDDKGKDIPHTSITTKEFNSVITKLWAWAKESKNPKVQEELNKQTLVNVSKIISIYKNELANNRVKSDHIVFNVDVLNGIQKHIYDSNLDPQFKLMFTNLTNKIIRPIYASYSENKKSESPKKKESEKEKSNTTDLIVKNLTERVIKTQMTRFTELINGGRRYWSKYKKSFNDLLNKYHITISETEIKFDNVTITLNPDNRISINIDETVKTNDNYRQILYDFTTIIVPDNIDTLLSQQKLKGIKNYKDLYSVILAPILFDVYNRTISEINYGQLKDLSKIISIINGSDVSSVIKNSEGNNLPLFRLPCLIYLHKNLYNDIKNRLEETDKNSPYLINPIYQNIDRVKKPVIKAELNYNDQVKQSADWAFDSLIHTAIVCDYYHSLVGTQSYEENAKTASGIMSFQTTVFSDKNTHYNNLFDTNDDWQFAQFGKYNIRSILENYLKTNDSTEFDELIDKFRQITYSQYRTLADKLISDYIEVFPDNTFDSLDDVENFIQDHNISDIRNSFYSNNKEFIEEFHYSKTGGKNGINETLKFLLDVFSTKEKYNEFTEIQLNWFLNHIKNNWETISSDSVIVSDFKNYLPQYVKDDKLLLESEGVLNPLIRSFYYLNTLISENYNSMMYGYLFYHPNKNNESTDAENYLIHCYSSRWTSQIKRMVIGGATYHPLAQGLKNGVLERVKMAVISDVDSNVRNISGMEDDVDSMDGSGYTNPYFSRMMNEALLDARVNGHVKKTIFHDIDAEYGTPKLLKWAEYEITNELRRNSKNLSLENIHKKMNSFPLSSFINFNKKYDNLYYVDTTNYETYQILEININNNVATRTIKDLTSGEIKIQTFKIETVYDLDQLYGGAWAKEINPLTNNLQFTEKNQDEVFNIICEFNLKNDIISWLVNKSALKVGASNLNPKGSWFDDTPLMYTTMSTKFGGLQMDADHDLNEAENRESTQMISALEQNGFTHDTVKEIYNLIAQSAELSLKKISDAVKSNDKETLYKIFEEEIIKSFQTGEKDTWGLAQSFIRFAKKSANKTNTTFKIPFSSSSINGMFNATVISNLIKKGIRRYFDGVAAVINPSHNVINYYNIDGINYRFEELILKIRSDLKDTNFSKTPINEILNNEYVHNNNGELEQNPYIENYSKDLIDYEDTIILSDSSIVKIDNYFKYIYYKHYYLEPVKIFKLKPKNLKASDTIFYSNDKRYSMFENKYTQLLYLLNNSELSKLSTFSKKDKKIKAIIKEYITNQLNNNSINVDDKIKNNIINNLFNLLKSELNSDINTPESLSKSLIDKLQDLLNDISDLKEIDWFGTKLKVDRSEVIPVQIVMGKLYAQQFGLLPGDSLAKIQQEKEKFFKKRIKSYYVNDNSDKFSYDWVLYDGTGNKLYVKLRKDNNIDILDKSSANSNYKVVNGKVYFKDKEICSENGKQFITYNDGEKQHDLVIIDDVDRFKEILNSGFFNHIHRNYRIDNYKDLVHEEFNDSIILLSNINKEGKIVIKNIAEYKTEKDIIRGLIINQKIKSDQEIWNLAKKRYESFIKSLNFIIVRIPCQSQQSFAPARIAFFTDSTNNEIYVPTNIFWLEGSDLDIDKQYVYGHSISDNGTIRTTFNEKQPEYIQQAALKNKIIEKQIEVITNPKNQINLTTPVTTNQVRKLSGKSELGKISKELQPFDPSSIFTMQIQTMTGKKVIGNVATGEKSFFALSYVYNEIFNSLYEALINNDFETVNYLLSKYTFVYTNIENNIPEIRTLANINLRKIKSILYIDQLENNKLIKVKNPAIPEDIWNTLDQLVNFQSRISDKAADAGELLNSATDNVKELTLKKINADVNWSDLYIYALIKGESLEEIGNFILNPYISSVLNSYSSKDLTRDITDDKVEYIKKSFQEVVMLFGNNPSWEENINLHKRLIDYVVGAKEFSVLGKILKINQGFNTNTTELYTYIKSIEKYIESRLNKKLLDKRDKLLQDYRIAKNFGSKEEASKLYNLYLVAKNKVQTDWIKFDLMRFISDENYANEYINYYEKVKVLFNILEPIKIIPHYNVMYQTLFLAKQVLNTLSVRNKLEDIIWNNTIHKSLVSENSDITKKLTNNELKDLKKQINEFIINEWIYNQHLSIPIIKDAINNPAAYNLVLDNEKSLDTFIEYFENFVIPKLKSTLPNNKFISLLTFGYKDNKHFFRLPFDMMQIDSNEYTQSLYDDVLEAFNDLKYIKIEGIGNNLVDLFYLYNLIINKDKLGPSSLTRIFEDIVSEKDSFVYKFNTWLDNQNADDLATKFFKNKSKITKISEDDLDSEKDLTNIPLTEYTNYGINSNSSEWSQLSKIYGIKTIDYTDTYKELSNEDKEQIEYIYSEIAKNLKRNYYTSKDIRSSILQTLSADSIYAIGYIINPGELDNKGFKNELNRQIVNDDIIFTVEYGIIQKKPIYVFDQKTESWYKWDYNLNSFQKIDTPILTPNFTSIESKNLTESGINAIKNVFEKTQEFIWGDNPNSIYDYNLDPEISFETYVNYTGFAQRSDTEWVEQSKLLGIDSIDTTKEYNDLNDEDKEDIEQKYLYVVDRLKRKVLDKDTTAGKLVRRDLLQARNADSIIAIGNILKPNEFDSKGYENKTDKEQVSGETAYTIEFAKLLHKPIFVFNQRDNKWYFWDYANQKYSETDTPILTVNFAGIGTREITESGKRAIQDVLNKTKQYFERNLSSDQLVTWARTAKNSYEVSTNGDSRFSALNAKFKEGTIIDGVDVSGRTIEDVYQNVIKKSGKGKAPAKGSKLNIEKPESNPFNISNVDEVKRSQYAKDSGIFIDHIESPTEKDVEDYQFTEIVIVTSNGDRIQLAPKAGFQDLNNVVKTKDIKALIGLNYLLENYLKSNPSEVNKFGNSVLSKYAKDVYGDNYDASKDNFQSDYASYIEYINSTNLSKEELEDYSYYRGYLPLWKEWARQNPELIEELRQKSTGKTLTDQFANTRVSQARALADILNEKSTNDLISQVIDFYSTITDEISIEYTPKGKTTQTYIVKKSHIYNKNGKEVFITDSVDRTKIYANVAVKENRAVIVNLNDSESYVVTNNNDIISITTGKLMKWNDTDSKRIKILELANRKFNKKQFINLIDNSELSNNTFKFNDGYEIETPFELNNEQKNALNKINDFIDSDKNIITLSGYAGTGKTSLMEILASKWSSEDKNVGFTATTHKATSVLKSKVQKYDFKTYTMHSLFGIQPSVDLNMPEFDIRKTIDGYIAKKSYPNIIVIDEASMINQEHYNFIRELAERNDLKIIFIGDPAQLKPVKSTDISPVFKNNDGEIIFLTKVERTDNNAILKTATNIRNNKELTYQTELNDKNEGIIYLQPSTSLIKKVILDNIDLIKEDINSFKILAFTNKKVQTYNELVRSLLNYDETPHIGEPIMMYDNKNRKENQYQLINSEIYEIVNVEESQLTKYLENINDSVFLKGWNLYLKDIDGNISSLFVIKVNQNNVEDLKKISKEIKLLWTKYSVTKNYRIYEQIQDLQNLLNVDKNITGPLGNVLVKKVWDFGYAHTIHKSQGSTYEKVLIDGDDIELAQTNEDVKQLKYVGITRAQKQVFYISTNTKLNNGNSNSDEIKKIAENWSKLEGWNTNYFYSKVLPRINEGVQIFYKLSDDQDSSVKTEANMSFSYGDYKRSDIKSNSTIEAIKNGERTATTRFKNIAFWKSLKKGDRIKFVSKETGDYIIVEITEPARKIIPESQDFYKTKPSIKAQLIEFIKSADNKYLHITTDANLLNEDASIRNAKGFIRNGEIYINVDRATNDTIIHEFGHLYLALSKITDTDKYYKILSKVRQTNLWTKLRQWDSYKNKRGSDFDEEVLAFMISNYYQGDLTYKDIVNEILEIVPNEFKDLLNSDILPILDESIITNYRLQQKIATIKNKLYNDDILKEDCK